MSFSFWAFIVLIALTAIAIVITIFSEGDDKVPAGLAAIVLGLLSVTFLISASVVKVDTRAIGVEKAFGRPTGTLNNGLHWIAPWHTVTEWDGKLQNLRAEGDKTVQVRLGNQSTANIDALLQYEFTNNNDVLALFTKYGDEKSLEDNLVRKSLQSAMNLAFKDYDPITGLSQAGDGRKPAVGMPELSTKALEFLRAELPPGIQVVTLTIVMPHYDAQTEDRIKAYNASIQDTAIATQRQQTAEALKKANDILAQSNASPKVLYQNCLDMVERVAKAGYSLPAGFSCSASGVIVTAK